MLFPMILLKDKEVPNFEEGAEVCKNRQRQSEREKKQGRQKGKIK